MRSPTFNPDVQEQRPGFSVYHPKRGEWYTPAASWSRSAKDAHVWPLEIYARATANMFAADVVTVPRWNGHFYSWDVIEPPPSVDQGWTTMVTVTSDPVRWAKTVVSGDSFGNDSPRHVARKYRSKP